MSVIEQLRRDLEYAESMEADLRGALNQMGCDLTAAQARIKVLEEALRPIAVRREISARIIEQARAALYPRSPGFAGGRDPQSDVL